MLRWARTCFQTKTRGSLRYVSENGEARTPSSNPYGICDLTCQNHRITWFMNSSRSLYQHHFETCEDLGFSKFCYASSTMQNKIQGADSSQLCLVPSVSANVSTQNPRSHAHVKKVINPGAKHLEHQRSTLGLLITTVKSLAPSSSPSRNIRRSHTQARNACIASTPIVPSSCRMYTPILTRPSS